LVLGERLFNCKLNAREQDRQEHHNAHEILRLELFGEQAHPHEPNGLAQALCGVVDVEVALEILGVKQQKVIKESSDAPNQTNGKHVPLVLRVFEQQTRFVNFGCILF